MSAQVASQLSNAPALSVAFLAGLISFLSPCVLPLLPSYLGVLGGAKAPMTRAVGFVLGFGVVFVALGATASTLGALLAPHKILLGQISAVLIVFFGLVMLGVIRPLWLMQDKRMLDKLAQAQQTRNMQPVEPTQPTQSQLVEQLTGPIILGAAFAFGWSPCLGPTLGSILGLAASSASLGQGVSLLAVYTLGLALPFLVAASLSQQLNVQLLSRHSLLMEKIGGGLLVTVGLLMLSGQFTRLAALFYGIMPQWLRL